MVACVRSAPPSTIADITARARANELKAVADLEGERIRVATIVTSRGLKKVERLIVSGTAYAVGTSHRKISYPYVTGRDPLLPAADAELLCYFYPEDMAEVGELTPGMELIVSGQFQEFSEGGRKVVLHSCELE